MNIIILYQQLSLKLYIKDNFNLSVIWRLHCMLEVQGRGEIVLVYMLGGG